VSAESIAEVAGLTGYGDEFERAHVALKLIRGSCGERRRGQVALKL